LIAGIDIPSNKINEKRTTKTEKSSSSKGEGKNNNITTMTNVTKYLKLF